MVGSILPLRQRNSSPVTGSTAMGDTKMRFLDQPSPLRCLTPGFPTSSSCLLTPPGLWPSLQRGRCTRGAMRDMLSAWAGRLLMSGMSSLPSPLHFPSSSLYSDRLTNLPQKQSSPLPLPRPPPRQPAHRSRPTPLHLAHLLSTRLPHSRQRPLRLGRPQTTNPIPPNPSVRARR